MIFFSKYRSAAAEQRLIEEKMYETVHEEIEQGLLRKGLWAKALSSAGGDENKAKSLYIKLRVQSIRDEVELKSLDEDRQRQQEAEWAEARRAEEASRREQRASTQSEEELARKNKKASEYEYEQTAAERRRTDSVKPKRKMMRDRDDKHCEICHAEVRINYGDAYRTLCLKCA